MITLLLAIVLGIFFTLIAVENSQLTTLNVFGLSLTLPLYLNLALAFLLGALVSSISTIFDWTGAFFDIKKKEQGYSNALRLNETLKDDIEKLRAENVRLKEELNTKKVVESERKSTERKEKIRNFFHRITHPGKPDYSHIA